MAKIKAEVYGALGLYLWCCLVVWNLSSFFQIFNKNEMTEKLRSKMNIMNINWNGCLEDEKADFASL